MTDWSLYPNFSEAEMRCKCGCGLATMSDSFLGRLQRIRTIYNHPIKINSAFRCESHNKAIGGAPSVHPSGHAVDVAAWGRAVFTLQDIAISQGMTGIGQKQHGPKEKRFMHMDDLSGPTRPWIWTYK